MQKGIFLFSRRLSFSEEELCCRLFVGPNRWMRRNQKPGMDSYIFDKITKKILKRKWGFGHLYAGSITNWSSDKAKEDRKRGGGETVSSPFPSSSSPHPPFLFSVVWSFFFVCGEGDVVWRCGVWHESALERVNCASAHTKKEKKGRLV